MSRSPASGAVAYAVETNFAEVSATFGTRLAIADSVKLGGFTQGKLATGYVTPFRNQIVPNVNGTKRGDFETKFMLAGHGSTCAGAVTLSDLETILGIALGRGAADVQAASATAGTTATSGGTATSLNVALAAGYRAGAIARAGALGDGRNAGQPFVVGAHSASAITVLTALQAALAAADVVYNPVNISTPESPANNTITSTRWRFQTGNYQVEAFGCYPKSITFEARTGQLGFVTIRWGCARWDFAAATFPSAGAMQAFAPAVIAGGSFFFAPVGSTARPNPVMSPRDFKLTYNLNVVELMGPGGIAADQDIVGCVRGRDSLEVEFLLDAEAATVTPLLPGYWAGNAEYHLLYGLNAVDGASVSMYMPYLVPAGDRPTQEDMEGLNRVRLKLAGGTGPTTTTELQASMLRIAMH
jgi:hypothetical protein